MKVNKKYSRTELIDGIRNYNSEILEFVYTENFKSIRRMVLSNSGDNSDAEDVFQESMLVLFRKVQEDTFSLTSTLNTFIYSIARLIWLKELNQRKKRPSNLDDFESHSNDERSVLSTIEYNDRLALYKEKFEELSDDCKKVLKMFINGIPVAVITQRMGYSSDQHTKNRRFRCKKSLITRIKESSQYKELGHENYKNDRIIPRW